MGGGELSLAPLEVSGALQVLGISCFGQTFKNVLIGKAEGF